MLDSQYAYTETIMKLRLAPSMAERFHRPLRFGSRWRGHELLLRLCQIAVIILLAGYGSRLVARFVAQASSLFTGG
jgi:hypothetical protein